jgi:hypothetical protein
MKRQIAEGFSFAKNASGVLVSRAAFARHEVRLTQASLIG